jgi:hypothetical protein
MNIAWLNYWWIAAFILLVFVALWRSRQARKRIRDLVEDEAAAAPVPAPAARESSPEGELVAVIAAAVATASGLSADRFRITQIEKAGAAGPLNTPPWGYVDRLSRSPSYR